MFVCCQVSSRKAWARDRVRSQKLNESRLPGGENADPHRSAMKTLICRAWTGMTEEVPTTKKRGENRKQKIHEVYFFTLVHNRVACLPIRGRHFAAILITTPTLSLLAPARLHERKPVISIFQKPTCVQGTSMVNSKVEVEYI